MSTKEIHIEKYDFDSWEKEQKPFVMVLTDVIQRLTMQNSQAFLIWVYLESLPPTWIPNKHHLMQHFDISARTYERHIGWLNTVGLIEYRQNRNAGGSFGKGRLVVLSGSKFNPDAASLGTVKIGGAAVNKKKAKVIHISEGHRTAKNGDTVAPSTTRASIDDPGNSPNRQKTEVRSNGAHINTTKRSTKERKKTNNPVSVFSDKETVKTHIEMVVTNRKDQEPLDDDILDQGIFYAYETNEDKTFDSVNKRINIFLKLVREGKWLIPQNWNGISSQSIREKEEREQAEKRALYQQEAQSAKNIFAAVTQGQGFQGFRAAMNKLKDDVNGKGIDEGAMPEKAVSSGN